MNSTGPSSGGGGRSGGVATASRGTSTPSGKSMGEGIESGRFSGGKAFGNTARFESSFSGKTFAAPGKANSSESGKFPSFSISQSGMIEKSSKSFTSQPKAESKPSHTEKKLTKNFGPKLEISNRFSQDTRRPSIDMVKPTTETIRPKQSLESSRVLYQRPVEAIKKQQEKPIVSEPKNIQPFRNAEAKVRITPTGEIKPDIAGKTLAPEVQKALGGRTEFVPVTSDGRLMQSSAKPEMRKNIAEVIHVPSRERKTMESKTMKSIMNKKAEMIVSLKQEQSIDTLMNTTSLQEISKIHSEIKPDAKKTPQSERSQVAVTETQKVLNSYLSLYSPDTGDTTQPMKKALSERLIENKEIRDDLEQAVHVETLLKAAYPQMDDRERQRIVLTSLDKKLEKTHLKPEIVTDAAQKITPEPDQTTQQTTASPEIAPEADRESEEHQIEEEQIPESVDEMAQIRAELVGAYERDQKRDQFRLDVAMQIAENSFNTEESEIPGDAFTHFMSQNDLYEKMQSEIAPGPDDYLTEIIEALSEQNYESVSQVKAKATMLIANKPAVLFGTQPNVSQQDVAIVQSSTRYPQS